MAALSSTVGPMRRFFVGDDVLHIDSSGRASYGVLVDIGTNGHVGMVERPIVASSRRRELVDGTFACPCYLEGRTAHDALCSFARNTSAENAERRAANLERVAHR